MAAVNGFTESVAAMAASLTAPLSASGPIPNRGQNQLLITSTALGSFGSELEEHVTGQLTLGEPSAVTQALERTQRLLAGALGSDDDLADSAADLDRRVLDKVRALLQTLVENEAVCSVALDDATVSFADVGQVRVCLERLISQENLREEEVELQGELQGVLPRRRAFEFRLTDSSEVIGGKIAPAIANPESLNEELGVTVRIKVMITTVGSGRPRYLLLEPPTRC